MTGHAFFFFCLLLFLLFCLSFNYLGRFNHLRLFLCLFEVLTAEVKPELTVLLLVLARPSLRQSGASGAERPRSLPASAFCSFLSLHCLRLGIFRYRTPQSLQIRGWTPAHPRCALVGGPDCEGLASVSESEFFTVENLTPIFKEVHKCGLWQPQPPFTLASNTQALPPST